MIIDVSAHICQKLTLVCVVNAKLWSLVISTTMWCYSLNHENWYIICSFLAQNNGIDFWNYISAKDVPKLLHNAIFYGVKI